MQVFVLFSTKTQKSQSEQFLLHYAILRLAELHNNKFSQLLWHSNLRVHKCTPSLCSQSVGQFTP